MGYKKKMESPDLFACKFHIQNWKNGKHGENRVIYPKLYNEHKLTGSLRIRWERAAAGLS